MDKLAAYVAASYPHLHKQAAEAVAASPILANVKIGALRPLGILGHLRRVFSPRAYAEAFNPQMREAVEEAARRGVSKGRAEVGDVYKGLEEELLTAQSKAREAAALRKEIESLRAAGVNPGGRSRLGWLPKIGIGAGLLGVPAAYLGGRAQAEQDAARGKLLAFGGGAAAGLFAPRILRGLAEGANRLSLMAPGAGAYSTGY